MEARQISAFRRALVLGLVSVACGSTAGAAIAASYRTPHFIVSAPTAEYAREVGETAERLRRELAEEWLGRELPPWRDICPIEVVPANGAGGVTQFYFDRGQPYGWTMRVQGSRERVLDSVLPHEITHTVFATHFGRPLPRWADEGACTTTEDVSERRKQEKLLNDFLRTNRGIPFNRMFEMTEYPSDVLPLYAQGYSLARFLIALEGKPRFVAFVGEGLKTKNWAAAIQRNYGFHDLSDLQVRWNRWVAKGADERVAARFGPEKLTANPAAIAAVNAPTTSLPNPATTTTTPLTVLPISNSTVEPQVPGMSYYARLRDEHRLAHPELMASRQEQIEKPARLRAVGQPISGVPRMPASPAIHAARPQPPQPAQQVIIEWSRPTSQTFVR